MNLYRLLLGSALICTALPAVVSAKEWRGLTPFHSTRADVERLLGPVPPPRSGRAYTLNENRSIYYVDEGDVYIIYKRDDCYPEECWKPIPTDTVIFIQVTFNKPISLKNFDIDLQKSKQFDPSSPRNIGFSAYIQESSGLMVRTFKGNVEEAYYFASPADKPKCPNYYDDLRGAANILVH